MKEKIFTPFMTPTINTTQINIQEEKFQMDQEPIVVQQPTKELVFTCSPWSKSLKQINANNKMSKEFLGKNYFFGDICSLVLSKDRKS